jgi:hypothetical protein
VQGKLNGITKEAETYQPLLVTSKGMGRETPQQGEYGNAQNHFY